MTESVREPVESPTGVLVEEVERGFRERDPEAFFVLPRVLRRVIRHELEITHPWAKIPHRKSLVVDRDRLMWLVALDELGAENATLLPAKVILIARPEEEQLRGLGRPQLQRYYWRMLFHARLDAVLQDRTAPDRMSSAGVRERIDRIGQTQFDEIRAVLRHEGMLLHPTSVREAWAEFVAVFCELRYFAPELVTLYFPSIDDVDATAAWIEQECPAAELYESTRPLELAGLDPGDIRFGEPPEDRSPPASPTVTAASTRRCYSLLKRAAIRRLKGNVVRAAILRQMSLDIAGAEVRVAIESEISADLASLCQRLQAALELDDDELAAWTKTTRSLLAGATRGYWNANARLLYDLQKVCLDHEQESYRIDLWLWLRTLGWSPLKRPLPNQRIVLIQKHLRTAASRMSKVRISPEERRGLESLLHEALAAAEHILRRGMRPLVQQSFQDIGHTPHNVVERVAFGKLVDELMDQIVDRGFLTMGDLRDGLSRNNLKLPDLSSWKEFSSGDTLLQADRRFAVLLDGVYQKGPFYLRWLQRLSSLAFGTPQGRFLTKYVAIPFGGAYLIIEGLNHLIAPISAFLIENELHLYHKGNLLGLSAWVLGVGCFLFALIHGPWFRAAVVDLLVMFWHVGKGLLVDWPRALWRMPLVADFLRSLPFKLFRRYFVSPILLTFTLWLLLPFEGTWSRDNRWLAAGLFVATFALLNSRLGRDTEEVTWEWMGRTWQRIRAHLILGLFNLIVDLFRQFMDGVERVLYAVDEWLRFRSGETSLTLAFKAVLGAIWSLIHSVIRFCVTLLIEPQVNPIKHFPVVTVSHKLILPFTPTLVGVLKPVMGSIYATTVGTAIVTSIPGVFGFLAWELKENWRLYAANRSPRMRPVMVGHHGETIARLLKPGFHSGTIPKLFARRRRTARKYRLIPELNRQSRYEEQLHHLSERIVHFVERELLAVLAESTAFRSAELSIGAIVVSTNRFTVELANAACPDRPIELVIAEQSGWLLAGIARPGWISTLNAEQCQVLRAALAGLYKLAGVDLVREQIESKLGSPPHPYDIAETGLVVWPNRNYDAELHYPLKDTQISTPRPRSLARSVGLERLPLTELVFQWHHIEWADWTSLWDGEAETGKVERRLVPGVRLLPETYAG